jgi:hypothetical protein
VPALPVSGRAGRAAPERGGTARLMALSYQR